MGDRTPYRPGDPRGLAATLLHILTYVVIVVVCTAIGGGVGSCGPYVLADTASGRSGTWDFAEDDRVGDIKRRFVIGAVIGGVFGVSLAGYWAIKTRRGEP